MSALANLILWLGNILSTLIAIMLVTGGGFLHFGHLKVEVSSPEAWMIGLVALGLIWTRALGQPIGRFGWAGSVWSWVERRLLAGASTAVPARILLGAVFAVLCIAHIFRHLALHNHGCDVSMVHQPLFYPWGNPPLHADFSRVGTALSEHLLYTFFLIAPVTSLCKSDFLIYVIQALLIGVALAALVLRGPLKKTPQALLFGAFLVLSYKALRASVVWDFREDAIAFASFIGMMLALASRRFVLYFVFVMLAILTKENIFAITLIFCVPVLFSREFPLAKKERKAVVAATAAISLIYGVLAFKVLIPSYTHNDQGHALFSRYGAYGHTVSEIAINILITPRIWFELASQVFNRSGILYLLFLLLPIAPFLRSREALVWMVPALAGILMKVAHPYFTQRMMIFHYELIIFPFLFFVALAGIRDAVQTRRISKVLWALVFGLCVFGRPPGFELQDHFPSLREWQSSRALAALQYGETVAVDERLSAQVNHLPHLHIFTPPLRPLQPGPELETWMKTALRDQPRYVIIDQDLPAEIELRNWLLSARAEVVWGELGKSRALVLRQP